MANIGTIKYKKGSDWIDVLHPINSFYISRTSTSPSSLFGGTWVQITNAVLRGYTSSGYTGNDTHTLTISEMPAHRHSTRLAWGSNSGKIGLKFYNSTSSASSESWDGSPTTGNYIGSSGGGAAHTNLQRSFNCFIWYRTA